MNLPYIIFLITFLLCPIATTVLHQFKKFDKVPAFFKGCVIFFIVYDTLFLFGISFIGDYADYFMFSAQYLIACLAICLKPKNTLQRILSIAGRTFIILGIIVGFVGHFYF